MPLKKRSVKAISLLLGELGKKRREAQITNIKMKEGISLQIPLTLKG